MGDRSETEHRYCTATVRSRARTKDEPTKQASWQRERALDGLLARGSSPTADTGDRHADVDEAAEDESAKVAVVAAADGVVDASSADTVGKVGTTVAIISATAAAVAFHGNMSCKVSARA